VFLDDVASAEADRALAAFVSALPDLQWLVLDVDCVGDATMQAAAGCTALSHLQVSDTTRVTDAGVAAVAAAGRLQVLWLRYCPRVTDASMRVIADSCMRLRVLNIVHTSVTDVGISALTVRKLPFLEMLDATPPVPLDSARIVTSRTDALDRVVTGRRW
jgi:hypothetical protein